MMKIMPTERSSPPVKTGHRLAHRDQSEQDGLVGSGRDDRNGEAHLNARRYRYVNISDEDGKGQERPVVLDDPEPQPPSCPRALALSRPGRGPINRRPIRLFQRQVEGAGHDVVLGDVVAHRKAHGTMPAVVQDGDTITASHQLVIVRGVEEDRRSGIGQLAQQADRFPASCRRRSRASGRSSRTIRASVMSHFADNDLLLIATGKRRDRPFDVLDDLDTTASRSWLLNLPPPRLRD